MTSVKCTANSAAQLRDQVSGASGCRHIELLESSYDLSAGTLTLSKNVTLIGDGAVLDGKGQVRVLDVHDGVHALLHGIEITGGHATSAQNGGGILTSGKLDMINCNLTKNTAVNALLKTKA
jgi:hypothetical protein